MRMGNIVSLEPAVPILALGHAALDLRCRRFKILEKEQYELAGRRVRPDRVCLVRAPHIALAITEP